MAFIDCPRAMLLMLAIAYAPSAYAWVKVCNGRGQTVMAAVALGNMGPEGTSVSHPTVTVEGWWKLRPGKCAIVSEADARQNWLYFHATSKSGRLEGQARLCVRNAPFTSRQEFLRANERCTGKWSEAGFQRRESSSKNFRFTIR